MPTRGEMPGRAGGWPESRSQGVGVRGSGQVHAEADAEEGGDFVVDGEADALVEGRAYWSAVTSARQAPASRAMSIRSRTSAVPMPRRIQPGSTTVARPRRRRRRRRRATRRSRPRGHRRWRRGCGPPVRQVGEAPGTRVGDRPARSPSLDSDSGGTPRSGRPCRRVRPRGSSGWYAVGLSRRPGRGG